MSPTAAVFAIRIGQATRERRKALGISQEAFADLIGMHRTYYGAVERGEKDCQLSTLRRVAAGLGVPLSRLLSDAERHGTGSSL
jgi:transcriptional regulator with XRE-family HTH domain